jgi:signal transduction histidine kinase
MLADELRTAFLTSGLTGDQLTELLAAGEEIEFDVDTELFHEGSPADFLWILLDGAIEMSRHSGGEVMVLTTMVTPGQWAGGLTAWGDVSSGAGYRATGRAVKPGRVFRLPSEDLGRLVGEWFPFGKHIMVGLYQTVRAIEATVRQRESLVALGALAAGLAHELNNPAAASLRAVEELRRTCDSMLNSLVDLARQSTAPEQYVELDRLRRELAARPAPDDGTVASMEREDALGSWLEARDVGRGWELVPQFAAAGADTAWLEHVELAVGSTAMEPALRWAVATLNASALLGELTDSTNRISNLVDAVRSYSQLDRASRRRTDVHEGIDSTLVMMAPKLARISIERAYGADVPEVEAYPAELNQVWTNLVDNAIDAMDGDGTLRISTRCDGSDLVVEINDTGHGMDDAVQARALEPFFTTKDVGKGTGLGLDISRRIVVERHGGDISFDSRPGDTTVRVRLPISH